MHDTKWWRENAWQNIWQTILCTKSGSLNLLEPLGPVQACNGIALHYVQRQISSGHTDKGTRKFTAPIETIYLKNATFVQPNTGEF